MPRSSDKFHIVIINGSVRPGNYTNMASALVLDELKKHSKVSTEVIDPATLSLTPPGTDPQSKVAKHLQHKVGHATGVILATPEYYGSFSNVMKLVIENLGYPSPLAVKPVALLGVAGGTIGAVKSLEHLRSVVSHYWGDRVTAANFSRECAERLRPRGPMLGFRRGAAHPQRRNKSP